MWLELECLALFSSPGYMSPKPGSQPWYQILTACCWNMSWTVGCLSRHCWMNSWASSSRPWFTNVAKWTHLFSHPWVILGLAAGFFGLCGTTFPWALPVGVGMAFTAGWAGGEAAPTWPSNMEWCKMLECKKKTYGIAPATSLGHWWCHSSQAGDGWTLSCRANYIG